MDNNSKEGLSDFMVCFVIFCCIAGCTTCNYFDNHCNNHCDKKCKSKIEQVK